VSDLGEAAIDSQSSEIVAASITANSGIRTSWHLPID
jgi:hypothetical protein